MKSSDHSLTALDSRQAYHHEQTDVLDDGPTYINDVRVPPPTEDPRARSDNDTYINDMRVPRVP